MASDGAQGAQVALVEEHDDGWTDIVVLGAGDDGAANAVGAKAPSRARISGRSTHADARTCADADARVRAAARARADARAARRRTS